MSQRPEVTPSRPGCRHCGDDPGWLFGRWRHWNKRVRICESCRAPYTKGAK